MTIAHHAPSLACPLLVEGKDYGTVGRWPVTLFHNVTTLAADLGARFEFYSGDVLLSCFDRGAHTIMAGYSCDGYSPTFWLFGKLIRLTPTPKCGMFPAVRHDNTRQMLGAMQSMIAAGLVDWKLPYTRKDTDTWFYNDLVAGGVNPHIAGTYYKAVEGPIGTAFIAMTRKTDPSLRVERIPYPETP